jgi:N12 class adenine-specific DNA methylase/adenine-specific DNA methylase
MSNAAQYSLGLFETTALGWTLDAPRENPSSAQEPTPISSDACIAASRPASRPIMGKNFYLDGDRKLARNWAGRAQDNIRAITLSKEIEEAGRAASREEQEQLLRFIGFGATDLAQNAFPLPGVDGFRESWKELGESLVAATNEGEYAALQRATQYAHYTPEPLIRAIWRAAQHLGFGGGRVLEPGMGTGLFFSLLPETLRAESRLTGIEYDPITARIARLLYPQARIHCEDYTRSRMGGGFDLAIGNPPFADRVVRGDPTTASLGLRLHDYFIGRSISRLRPGGIALFVTSTGTMDKANRTAREYIAAMADLIGAVRLPEGSMKATAGTEVVIDILAFQRRPEGAVPAGETWMNLGEVRIAGAETGVSAENADIESDPSVDFEKRHLRRGVVEINEYFVAHPEMVLGEHSQRRGIYGPGWSYTCLPTVPSAAIEAHLDRALSLLPAGITSAPGTAAETAGEEEFVAIGRAADGAAIKEGSYIAGRDGRLCQIIDGKSTPVEIRSGKGGEGMTPRATKVIRSLMPIRDAVRDILRAQAAGRPWVQAQIKLRQAYSAFIRYYGPINHTVVSVTRDAETGEEKESHRRPNLAHFSDDPDCWLVASIEEYDLESGLAKKGPIFDQRVVSPPMTPVITSATDALAVTLNEIGYVDPERLAELLECEPAAALGRLGTTVYRNPATEGWETADAYLSGPVRTKLAAAQAAAAIDPQYNRNVEALLEAQPKDIPPSGITARLGAPWIPTADIEAFTLEVMETKTRIFHMEEVATWTVEGHGFVASAAGTSDWGTPRRHAGTLLHDALNSATPQIFDTEFVDGTERRVLNAEATEAAKEKLNKIKAGFSDWIWTGRVQCSSCETTGDECAEEDPILETAPEIRAILCDECQQRTAAASERADRLTRLYNDRFNNLVPRHFDGSHLTLPGASNIIRLYGHQKRVIWRIISTGSTYMAHAVGAGKTYSMAAAVMEQRRLGLIAKSMLVVPGHCLAQASREFLQLYPTARILVADETNFSKDKRARFLARAATAAWDAIIITHSAFRFIGVPAGFERQIISDMIDTYEALKLKADSDDRVTRKRLEAMRERLSDRLEAIKDRRDDMVTIEEIGIDQIIVDEAQEFRKLSFATNRLNLKGVDPDGSQRAWDLYVKTRFIDAKNPRRALIQASGTPITNTLGEMFTLLRFQNEDTLHERGVHEFDAWAASFGDTRTELELQPSGSYKPVERFSQFVNVPELIDMFRACADVVLKDDLRQNLRLPRIKTGQRQLITADATEAFRDYQSCLADRISEIESRTRKAQKGDDILLSVITDGRHAAIDMRLVGLANDNEPENKLNKLIENVHRIWRETTVNTYLKEDGTPYPIKGAGQLIFSDLGTINVEAKRGFSAYRWIRQELIRLGIPASEIAYMQDYKRSSEKQRLFNEFNAGRVRIVIGSSDTMGTGVNAQRRLKALHHLDVPWLPSQIEQREGRIERQGNQNDEIEIYAYATLGSMDATMWQNNERKARFIAAALSGDRSIRSIDDIGEAANQFALAKAIASGDARLMQKAGLEAEIARLDRQRAAHFDDQLNIRRRIANTKQEHEHAKQRIVEIGLDLQQQVSTRGDSFRMEYEGRTITERRVAGTTILSKVRLAERGKTPLEKVLGSLGGFPLICHADRGWRSEFEANLLLRRNGLDQEISIDAEMTPIGLISRLEHTLERFGFDLQEQERRASESLNRLQGYEGRSGQSFHLQAELDGKLATLARLDADLAATAKKAA